MWWGKRSGVNIGIGLPTVHALVVWAAMLSPRSASVSSVVNVRTRRAVHALAVWAGRLSTRGILTGLRASAGRGGRGGGETTIPIPPKMFPSFLTGAATENGK